MVHFTPVHPAINPEYGWKAGFQSRRFPSVTVGFVSGAPPSSLRPRASERARTVATANQLALNIPSTDDRIEVQMKASAAGRAET